MGRECYEFHSYICFERHDRSVDVGLVVSFTGLIATAFAFLAGVALAVELGVAPGKKSAKVKSAKEEASGSEVPKSKGSSRRRRTANSTDNGGDTHEERLLDDASATEAEGLEKTVATNQNPSPDAINNLQRTYVDGLLGPRKKYDVALAILNEYKTTSVSEEEAGKLMATQAYLSATRTGSLSSGAFKTPKKETKEIDAPKRKDTKESTTPPKKTGERSRPPSASRKTTTGDSESAEQPKGTARNTKRRNTRPE